MLSIAAAAFHLFSRRCFFYAYFDFLLSRFFFHSILLRHFLLSIIWCFITRFAFITMGALFFFRPSLAFQRAIDKDAIRFYDVASSRRAADAAMLTMLCAKFSCLRFTLPFSPIFDFIWCWLLICFDIAYFSWWRDRRHNTIYERYMRRLSAAIFSSLYAFYADAAERFISAPFTRWCYAVDIAIRQRDIIFFLMMPFIFSAMLMLFAFRCWCCFLIFYFFFIMFSLVWWFSCRRLPLSPPPISSSLLFSSFFIFLLISPFIFRCLLLPAMRFHLYAMPPAPLDIYFSFRFHYAKRCCLMPLISLFSSFAMFSFMLPYDALCAIADADAASFIDFAFFRWRHAAYYMPDDFLSFRFKRYQFHYFLLDAFILLSCAAFALSFRFIWLFDYICFSIFFCHWLILIVPPFSAENRVLDARRRQTWRVLPLLSSAARADALLIYAVTDIAGAPCPPLRYAADD